MCSHRLAAVLDELHSAVHLVLVNSSRAWSSSGGVVVINVSWRCADPSPAYGGCATPRQCWTRTRDRWDRGRRWAQVMPAVGVHRAVLRSADLVALGCVRLPCRQDIDGGEDPAGSEVHRGGTGR
jgi:hypothetical protein